MTDVKKVIAVNRLRAQMLDEEVDVYKRQILFGMRCEET